MRFWLYIITFLIFSNSSAQIKLEEVKTDGDVLGFLKQYAKETNREWRNVKLDWKDKRFKKYYSKDQVRLIDSITRNKWLLNDFNDDGRKDLLVCCKIYNYFEVLGFVSKDDTSYSLLNLSTVYSRQFPSGVNFLQGSNQEQIILFSHDKIISNPEFKINYRQDTLVYKISSFVEYRQVKEKTFEFDSLSFSINNIWPNSFEIPKIVLYSDGKVTLYQSKHLDTLLVKKWTSGIYTCNIPFSKVLLIKNLLAEIDYLNVNAQYEVDGSDYPTFVTEVFFKGNRKRVFDYGGEGTYGLRLLYKELGILKNNCRIYGNTTSARMSVASLLNRIQNVQECDATEDE